MIETTGKARDGRVLDATYFPGWIRRYVEAHEGTRFPLAFHALVGTYVLTSFIGRRARLRRDGYVLWPPASILLLGHSGVGKSASLNLGRQMLTSILDENERPAFVLDHALEYTPSSLIQEWKDKQEDLALDYLEGAVTANELKAILKERTGNENASQFLIEACEHKDLTSKTVSRGTRTVKGLTVAFAFCSSLHYLRQSLSVDEFGGGLMHRFLIAHEMRKLPRATSSPSDATRTALAADLKALWQHAPDEMAVAPEAQSALDRCRAKAEERYYVNAHLSGFWNRFDAIVAKLALAFALADGSATIAIEHVDMAREFIEAFMYPPMEALVTELSYGFKERRLFDLADNLALAGDKGIDKAAFMKSIPGTSLRAKQEALATMEGLSLARVAASRIYRR